MASFLVFLPAILLSGFMFPVTSMPEVFQWVTLAEPRPPLHRDRARGVPQGSRARSALAPVRGARSIIGTTVLLFATWRFRKS